MLAPAKCGGVEVSFFFNFVFKKTCSRRAHRYIRGRLVKAKGWALNEIFLYYLQLWIMISFSFFLFFVFPFLKGVYIDSI